ncbi:MAG TPA: TerC family protein [Candidatus Limnocylindria bacterium]|nr:TerC family protein [Candidatus Limnocylindria bacterium]
MLAEIVITPWHWAGFVVCILIFLALDLGVFHRSAHVVKFKEAFAWTAVWFTVAMLFAVALGYWKSREDAEMFVTGYLLELSLSMDNVFVIALLFAYFKVPTEHQHRVLFWGIMGALIMRGVLIAVGAALVMRFHWVLYIFGAFLLFTGIKMFFAGDGGVEPENNLVLKLVRKFFPLSPKFEGQKFFTQLNGRRALTPLAVVLLMVETTDLVFALDSIPAIFGVTQKPFIVFTSNVFAILGLRSLYFVLANAIDYFRFLKYGLALVLVFIGAKMLAEKWVHVPTRLSLGIVAGIILFSVLLSVLLSKRKKE